MFIKIQAILSNKVYRLSKLLSKILVITLALTETALATGESSDGISSKNAEHDNFCLLWKSVYSEAHRDFRKFIDIHQTENDVISADSLVNFPHTQCDIFVDLKKESSQFICKWKYTLQDKNLAIEETLKFSKSIRGCISAKYPAKNKEPLYIHKTPLKSSKTVWSDSIIDSDNELLKTYIGLMEIPDRVDRKGNIKIGSMELKVEISYNDDE